MRLEYLVRWGHFFSLKYVSLFYLCNYPDKVCYWSTILVFDQYNTFATSQTLEEVVSIVFSLIWYSPFLPCEGKIRGLHFCSVLLVRSIATLIWLCSRFFYTVCFHCVASWGLSKYIGTKLQSICSKLFQKVKKGLELVSLPHFLHDFLKKIFLLFYSINRPNFIVRLPLLREILSNICFNCFWTKLWRHKFWN